MQNVYISYLFSQKTHPKIDVFHKTKSKNQAIPMVRGLLLRPGRGIICVFRLCITKEGHKKTPEISMFSGVIKG